MENIDLGLFHSRDKLLSVTKQTDLNKYRLNQVASRRQGYILVKWWYHRKWLDLRMANARWR